MSSALLSIQDFEKYKPHYEVRFGRKRIDLLMISPFNEPWIAVELKIRNWKKALWQSVVNREIADFCFVALYERFVPAALSHKDLFEFYGVGLICTGRLNASIVLPATRVHNLTRLRQQLLTANELGIKKEDGTIFETVPVLLP